MKRIISSVFCLVAIALCFTFCTKTVYIPVERKTEVIVEKHDTIIQTRIEKQVVEVVSPDTSAYTETSLAWAEASWCQQRLKLHVENKDTIVPIRSHVVYKTTYCSIPQPYKVEVIKEVVITKWYDKVLRIIGGVFIATIFGYTILKVKRYV